MPHTFLELMDLIATQAKRAVERNDSPIVHIKEVFFYLCVFYLFLSN